MKAAAERGEPVAAKHDVQAAAQLDEKTAAIRGRSTEGGRCMPNPVSRITIHHEGAGSPTDNPRGADGGYSIWIGKTNYTILRTPWESFGTYHFNHVSLDICLSGNRVLVPVTNNDIGLIRDAVAEARRRGWVIGQPTVVPHKDSPGSRTVCPGAMTMTRWTDVQAACTKKEFGVKPKYSPPVQVVDTLNLPGKGSWALAADGGVYTIAGTFHGSMAGKPDWGTRQAARLVKAGAAVEGARPPLKTYPAWAVYEIIATSGERYLPKP